MLVGQTYENTALPASCPEGAGLLSPARPETPIRNTATLTSVVINAWTMSNGAETASETSAAIPPSWPGSSAIAGAFKAATIAASAIVCLMGVTAGPRDRCHD